MILPASERPAPAPEISEERTRAGKWLIIVVDDNHDHLTLTCWSLVAAGFKAMGFTEGAAALSILTTRHDEILAVITDLSMPVLDGLTIAEELRRNEQALGQDEVPLAFFTAHDQAAGGATERIAERCHVDRIWHKPNDVQRIGDLVKGWLLGYEERHAVASSGAIH